MSAHAADLIVVGGGPAGMAGAAQAAALGLRVVLVDEGDAPGGQVYRQGAAPLRPAPGARRDPDTVAGARLRDALASSGAKVLPGRALWALEPGFTAHAAGPAGPETIAAPRLLIAAGAHERIVPFDGWTQPEVIGLAAATILLKAQHVLPGARIVVAGAGPLVYAVAAGALELGGAVAAVVDLARRRDWAVAAAGLATRPGLALRGARWMARLRAAGTPVHFASAVREATPTEVGVAVTIGPVDAAGHPAGATTATITADALCVGHGLVPATDLARLAGARMRHDRQAGGWVPQRDAGLRLSVAGVYAAGDGTGILGAGPSETEGRLAAASAARDAGAGAGATAAVRAHRRRLALQAPAGRAAARLIAPRPAMVSAIASDCLVCRCEDVTRGEIEAAICDGARDVNQLKAWTRCGMGPCQGRICGETVAELVAAKVGGRDAAGIWTARSPLRPLDMADLVGDYGYDDIALPQPAPL